MNDFEINIKKNTIEELYQVYTDIISLINELESQIKDLPPKEEL